MPIYEYECSACKFYVEALQKISEPLLRKCPSCKKQTLKRLISAPVFRLKGGGWYETDFKSDQEEKRNLAEREEAAAPAEAAKDTAKDASKDAAKDAAKDAKGETKDKASAKAADAPAAKPAAKGGKPVHKKAAPAKPAPQPVKSKSKPKAKRPPRKTRR